MRRTDHTDVSMRMQRKALVIGLLAVALASAHSSHHGEPIAEGAALAHEHSGAPIPDRLRQQLNRIRTPEELSRHFDLTLVPDGGDDGAAVQPPPAVPLSQSTVAGQSRPMESQRPVNFATSSVQSLGFSTTSNLRATHTGADVFEASPLAANEGGTSGGTDTEGQDVEVIRNPRKAGDKCELMEVCVPLPVPKRTTEYVFPTCIALDQCVGACCDQDDSCHAQQTKPVIVHATRYVYNGGNKFVGHNMTVRMEKHVACGCRRCRQKRSCEPNQIMLDCDCACPNWFEKSNCKSPRSWNEDACECMCNMACPAGQLPDTQSCSCTMPVNAWKRSSGSGDGEFRARDDVRTRRRRLDRVLPQIGFVRDQGNQ